MDMQAFIMAYIWRKTIFRLFLSFTIITCIAWVYFSLTGLPHLETKRSGPSSKVLSATKLTEVKADGEIKPSSKTLSTTKLIEVKADGEIKRRTAYMRSICNTDVAKRYSNNFWSSLVKKDIYTYTPRERFTSKDVCFCKIPKSGSTFWGRALYMISHPDLADEIERFSGLEVHGTLFNQRAIPCTDFMINNSQSFMVTRNPWTRLYSAYIDKIYLVKYAELTESLLKTEDGLPDNKIIAENDCQSRIVSFECILKQVISWASSRENTLDSHFAPVSLLCDPCHYDYAFFIKQERLEQETNMAMDLFEIPGSLRSRLDMTQKKNYIQATVPNLVKTTMSIFESNNHSCLSKNDMYRRIWNVLQINGHVSVDLAFPHQVFDNQESFVVIANALTDYVLENRIESDAAEKQRNKFFEKAYAQVSLDVLRDVQRIFELDFLLFGYRVTPPGFKEDDHMFKDATALTYT
ncbi:hypothetical protein ACJMK2_039083 [Sinanodonta woodiana]|uniref:Carbohydrate sulfotransferase n=1 Tax=Sinanodonta woodiana TaxID=1069815 RepID=A0ABD3WEU2_SINWO